jgi:iron complex outermembrane receptor protein
MKQKFDRFGFFVGWLGIFVALYAIEPTLAETTKPETESYSISARDFLKQQISQAPLVKVTGIALQQTPNGLEIVLQTSGEQQLIPLILPEGNNLVIEILDATLALPEGNEFLVALLLAVRI